MRVLVLSDIHGNLQALEAVLAAAGKVDALWNLGDVVGYGGNPNEVVDLMRKLAQVNVRGNHDRVCCGLTSSHGSPLHEDQYIVTMRDAWTPLQQMASEITFFGHTHIQGGFSQRDHEWHENRPHFKTTDQPESAEIDVPVGTRHLINPGSVGQPRDQDWRAAFAIYDSAAECV